MPIIRPIMSHGLRVGRETVKDSAFRCCHARRRPHEVQVVDDVKQGWRAGMRRDLMAMSIVGSKTREGARISQRIHDRIRLLAAEPPLPGAETRRNSSSVRPRVRPDEPVSVHGVGGTGDVDEISDPESRNRPVGSTVRHARCSGRIPAARARKPLRRGSASASVLPRQDDEDDRRVGAASEEAASTSGSRVDRSTARVQASG
jgi:hypothetical protein